MSAVTNILYVRMAAVQQCNTKMACVTICAAQVSHLWGVM